MQKVKLYYERYMKSYDVVIGHGTLFCGDSGYCVDYNDFAERLTDDIKKADITPEIVKIDEFCLFIKKLIVTFD